VDPRTLCVHAGGAPDPHTGAVVAPLHLSTTFARDADGALVGSDDYGRTGNPTRRRLEEALARLEGGGTALAFASGMAAASAVLRTSCGPGDRVLLPDDVYYGVRALLEGPLRRWGLRPVPVDLGDAAALDAALDEGAALVWVETPSNPRLRITDLSRVVARAGAAGARVVADNTFATPILTRPLAHGLDAVIHSTTKYLGGHSDVVGGAVVLPQASPLAAPLREAQALDGAVPSPFDAYLVLRGLRTLALRVRAASEGAARLAAFLDAHPAVTEVAWPGLPSHPGHAIAARQMKGGFGGMLSFRVGSEARAREVAGRLELFVRATSLGGVESLVEHRAPVEGPDSATPRDLLRLSVGIEAPEDLEADLDRALRGLNT
jgi:cystathionine gamma-synthase